MNGRSAAYLKLRCLLDGEGPQLIAKAFKLNVLQVVHAAFLNFIEKHLHLRLRQYSWPTIGLVVWRVEAFGNEKN